MKLIVGLGNPENTYVNTRHNVGFMAVDALCQDAAGTWKNDKQAKATICELRIGSERILLAKPTTYMNRSGEAVQALMSFFKLEPHDVLIVHDDMDLQPKRMQFKNGGGPAGHNGVTDILQQTGTIDLPRLRIGIGRPPIQIHQEAWVLGKLSPEDTPNALDIVSALRDWIEYGIDQAANRWNRRS